MKLTNKDAFMHLANEWATLTAEKSVVQAEQVERLNATKNRFSAKIEPLSKATNALKAKLRRFLEKDATRIFGADKKTGVIESNQCEISYRENPPALTLIDPKASEEAIIAHAKVLGFPEVVVKREAISKDALGTLSDEDLERLGYKRTRGHTFTLKVLADKTQREKDHLPAQIEYH